MAFFVVFVFLRSLGLDLNLSLKLTHISKKEVIGLGFVFISMVLTRCIFFGGFMSLWIPNIDFFYF